MEKQREIATVLAILSLTLVLVPTVSYADPPTRFERTEIHMGTKFKIILYAADSDQASTAFNAAFARISQLDRCLSNYKPDSEVNRICNSAPHQHPVPLSEDFFRVLTESERIGQLSGGAFDVTIGPVTKLWRRARRLKKLPDSKRLKDELTRVGFGRLSFDHDRKTVQLQKAKMKIDLGGIAKGYAIDQAMLQLSKHKIDSALIDGGGDIAVSKAPAGRKYWQIQIADHVSKKPICLKLENQAVATSGDLYQFVRIDGIQYSHIVDPKTGVGTTHNVSTTVIAPNATTADGLASACAVLGSEKSIDMIEPFPQVHARWQERSGVNQISVRQTDRMSSFVIACETINYQPSSKN